jgi:hypothetical protein
VKRLLGLLEARRGASLRAAHLPALEGGPHPALVGDGSRRVYRQPGEAQSIRELRGGQHGLVRAHRRDRDRLDPLCLELAEHPVHVGEAAHDAVVGLGEQRRVRRAIDDADLVPKSARLLEQPELRARPAGEDERSRH